MRPAFWIAFPALYLASVIGLIALTIPAWHLLDRTAASPEPAVLYAASLIAIALALELAARMTRPFRMWVRAPRAQTVLTATVLGLGAAIADAIASVAVAGLFAVDHPASSFKAVAIGLITGALAIEWLRFKAERAARLPAAPGLTWTMADLVDLYRAMSRGDRDLLDSAIARRSNELITAAGSANHALWDHMAELGWLAHTDVPASLSDGALAGRFRAFAVTRKGTRKIPEFVKAAMAAELRPSTAIAGGFAPRTV